MASTNGQLKVEPLLQQLEQISEEIAQNTDAAASALEAFKTKHAPLAQKAVKAKTELLTLIIASVRNTYTQQGINDQKLISYFIKEKKYDEGAQVLLARARHFFLNGNVAEGEKVLLQVRNELLDKISPRVEVVYLTRMAFLHSRRNRYDEKMQVTLQALDKLKAMEPNTWNYNISTIFYTNIADCYMSNADFDKAWPYLQQCLEIAAKPNVSTYNKFNIYSYIAFFYENNKDYGQSAEWHEKIITLLKGDATHQTYLVQSYLMAIVQYHFLYRTGALTKKEQQHIIQRQEAHLQAATRLIKPDLTQGTYLQLLYASATLSFQKGEYKKAANSLNTCLQQYIKMKHEVSMLNCYRLAHEVYHAWGKQTGSAEKLLKAYELKQQESEMVEAQSRQSHLQKMEAIQLKYNLQQAELTGKLLQQQVDAMNKEAQLAALNLQEKVTLLDELKTFVRSLKKKDYDGKEFARAVSQKIGTVKITEQDKAVLQQKIDYNNQAFFNVLSESYPQLTTHEVRACALIKTGLTNKELSKLYGIGERGYEQLRHRIKKKMNLKREHKLVNHLAEISARAQQPAAMV